MEATQSAKAKRIFRISSLNQSEMFIYTAENFFLDDRRSIQTNSKDIEIDCIDGLAIAVPQR